MYVSKRRALEGSPMLRGLWKLMWISSFDVMKPPEDNPNLRAYETLTDAATAKSKLPLEQKPAP